MFLFTFIYIYIIFFIWIVGFKLDVVSKCRSVESTNRWKKKYPPRLAKGISVERESRGFPYIWFLTEPIHYIHNTWYLRNLTLGSAYGSAIVRWEPVLLRSNSWDAVVRSTQIIYIECTLNFWAISSNLKKCICGICPFFKCVYRLRPNNHCIIMKHLRTFWFIVCYGKNELRDLVLFCWSDMPLTCQCSTTRLIDLTMSLRRFIRGV